MSKAGKTEITNVVAERTDVAAGTVQRVINATFDAIAEQLAKGNNVTMRGFGTWRTKVLAPRTGRDPRTGEPLEIQARTRIAFKPGSALREQTETSIEPEIYTGEGVARETAICSVLNNVLAADQSDLILEQVRRSIKSLLGPAADREAREFFTALLPESVPAPEAVPAAEPVPAPEPAGAD